MVLAVETREVHVVPVTVEPPGEEGGALVVDGAGTAFGVDATVWVSLADHVGLGVLDRVVDAWGDEIVEWTVQAVLGQPGPVPERTRGGQAVLSTFDPSAEVRAELADNLRFLRGAPRLPVQESGTRTRDLAALLKGRLDLAALMRTLGLPQAEVMNLVRGKVPLQPGQVAAIAEVTGLPAQTIAGAVQPLPVELAVEAEHPRLRAVWVRRAKELRMSEAEARVSGSYDAFTLAARETGGTTDWGARLRQCILGRESTAEGR
ncbi:hypothetical protein [Streptomyces sp. NPDC059909]|uniref:hypothetical protein n=1 Tax=Streptomyces sp. NPDC059909 TaxID=3346998 RepID=UPI0036488BB0